MHTRRVLKLCVVCIAFAVHGAIARADVLFDQMTNCNTNALMQSSWLAPNGFDGDVYAYDNFLLASDATITEVWWVGGGGVPTGFTIRVYTGLAAAPDLQPTITALPESETSANYLRGYRITGTANQTPIPGTSANQYHFTLPTSLSLPGNTVYWIKIEADMSSGGWGIATATQGRDTRHFNYFTGLAMFLAGSGSEAFQLRGTFAGGACCLSDGSCTVTASAAGCAGSFQGLGITCASIACPQPTGACCSGAHCTVTPPASCTGVFQGTSTTCGSLANPTTCCVANFDGIGGLQVADIFAFLNAWFARDAHADVNGSGTLEVQDIFDFLSAWFAGCL